MANFKYFVDVEGQEPVELARVWHDGHVSAAARHFSGKMPDGSTAQATRKVEYRSSGNRHQCNAKCMSASGKSPCSCSCGGRNHGRAV